MVKNLGRIDHKKRGSQFNKNSNFIVYCSDYIPLRNNRVDSFILQPLNSGDDRDHEDVLLPQEFLDE